jgi:hypothetical protein
LPLSSLFLLKTIFKFVKRTKRLWWLCLDQQIYWWVLAFGFRNTFPLRLHFKVMICTFCSCNLSNATFLYFWITFIKISWFMKLIKLALSIFEKYDPTLWGAGYQLKNYCNSWAHINLQNSFPCPKLPMQEVKRMRSLPLVSFRQPEFYENVAILGKWSTSQYFVDWKWLIIYQKMWKNSNHLKQSDFFSIDI